ncbi:MAG TPA: hypothetical protein VIN59_06700 [Alphaproteobacteria bacterium]
MRALFEDVSGYVLNADIARGIEEDFAASVARDFNVEIHLPWRKGRRNIFLPPEPQIVPDEISKPVPAAEIMAFMKAPISPEIEKAYLDAMNPKKPEPKPEVETLSREMEQLRRLLGRLTKPAPLTF